jgi:hypothetical protein
MENNQIQLIQEPKISHQLLEIGQSVDLRLSELNIENQIATIDTVKSLKDLRAELNKELTEFEEQRKTVKKAILSPYEEFETVYKSEISEKYTKAISVLKDKIGTVENQIKTEKLENVKRYFDELCTAVSIDFIKFEQLKIEINLTTTEKKYKDQINEIIEKVQDDLNLIKSTDFEAETMAEYKISLNASKAITAVKTRKEQERVEAVKIKATETLRRINQCKMLGMVYIDITNSYEFDTEIYVRGDDIEDLNKEDYTKLISSIESRINDVKSLLIKQRQAETTLSATPIEHSAPKTPIAPIQAPKVEVIEKQVIASFEVSGTMAQLRNLGAYMKQNGITYKNI